MMEKEIEIEWSSRKAMAVELANLIAIESQEISRVQELLEKLMIENPSDGERAGNKNEPHEIGIWRKTDNVGNGTRYVRSPAHKREWLFWADREEFTLFPGKKKIVLLGESVARGFHYDPFYCPADVLHEMLNKSGFEDQQVIDLAKISIGLSELKSIAVKALEMKPDALIIFAGNNWMWDLFSSLNGNDFPTILETLQQKESFKNLKEYFEKRLKDIVNDYLQHLNEITKNHGVPIIFIVPEFNLADWKSTPSEVSTPWIPDGLATAWTEAKLKLENEFKSGDFQRAAELAETMSSWDGSKSPWPLEMNGICQMHLNNHARAWQLLQEAKDSALLGRLESRPRILEVIRSTVVETLKSYEIPVVDLRDVFKNYSNDELPGKEFFLDYCHLTSLGIQLASRETCKNILSIFGRNVPGQWDLLTVAPDKETEGVGNLMAAISNAYWGQPYDSLLYNCRKALEYSPRLREAMQFYIDLSARRTSNVLCDSHSKLIDSGVVKQFQGGVGGFFRSSKNKLMDLELAQAMMDALKEYDVDVRSQYAELLESEHSVNKHPLNLLDTYYSRTSYDGIFGRKRAYYQSRDINSRFLFVVGNPSNPLSLTCTVRLPSAEYPADSVARIIVNGKSIGEEKVVVGEWISIAKTIESRRLIKGINTIVIEWPCASMYSMPTNNSLSFSPEATLMELIHPIYGEIYSMDICEAHANA